MPSVQQLLERRVSAQDFVSTAALDVSVIEQLLASARLAPSAYNLQHTRYLIIDSEDDKQRLYQAAYFQKKLLQASVNIVVLADTHADLAAAEITAACVAAGNYDQTYAERQCQQIASIYQQPAGAQRRRDEAIRAASLASMCILLRATEIGLGSCPLSGFDEDKLQQTFALPTHVLPVMIISLGSAVAVQPKPRKPVAALVLEREQSV